MKHRIRRFDSRNWVLERKTQPKAAESKEAWEIVGYYAEADGAARSALRQGITGTGATEILASIAEAEARVAEMVRLVVRNEWHVCLSQGRPRKPREIGQEQGETLFSGPPTRGRRRKP